LACSLRNQALTTAKPSQSVVYQGVRLSSFMHHCRRSQQKQRRVEWHRRDVQDRWAVAVQEGSGSTDIACHDWRKTITMDEIYEVVTPSYCYTYNSYKRRLDGR